MNNTYVKGEYQVIESKIIHGDEHAGTIKDAEGIHWTFGQHSQGHYIFCDGFGRSPYSKAKLAELNGCLSKFTSDCLTSMIDEWNKNGVITCPSCKHYNAIEAVYQQDGTYKWSCRDCDYYTIQSKEDFKNRQQ